MHTWDKNIDNEKNIEIAYAHPLKHTDWKISVCLHSQNFPLKSGLQTHIAWSLTVLHTAPFLQGFVLQGPKPAGEKEFIPCFPKVDKQETLFPSHVSQRWTNQETLFSSHVSQWWTNQETWLGKNVSWFVHHWETWLENKGGQTRKHLSQTYWNIVMSIFIKWKISERERALIDTSDTSLKRFHTEIKINAKFAKNVMSPPQYF
jgi:hypothetical protein